MTNIEHFTEGCSLRLIDCIKCQKAIEELLKELVDRINCPEEPARAERN